MKTPSWSTVAGVGVGGLLALVLALNDRFNVTIAIFVISLAGALAGARLNRTRHGRDQDE